MRIIFMGSPEFAVPTLEKLYENKYEIAAVYTQPDRPAGRGRKMVQPAIKTVALKMGLKVEQPEKLKTETEIKFCGGASINPLTNRLSLRSLFSIGEI